ncbi:VanZ like protein [Candidatus Pelagibacter ubique]|uniref:VanZ like protein n=1 Tax=Pelagibacter ubique TaxID=198252 RepID=A0ABX1T020_PELUQ|nr:VanZ family protein [Candidatus Pelagibacter ubique]NMN67436.1 VanZ like protein [Candidatus Pelagibacter ubique]
MKYIKKLLILGFHSINLILIIFYLYPGSIFGCYLYNNCYVQPQITKNFIVSSKYLVSSNHVYVFIILSFFGILAYYSSNKIKFLITYLFSLSIILELFHLIIPNRGFEWSDLFGNILGVTIVIIIYNVKNKYV